MMQAFLQKCQALLAFLKSHMNPVLFGLIALANATMTVFVVGAGKVLSHFMYNFSILLPVFSLPHFFILFLLEKREINILTYRPPGMPHVGKFWISGVSGLFWAINYVFLLQANPYVKGPVQVLFAQMNLLIVTLASRFLFMRNFTNFQKLCVFVVFGLAIVPAFASGESSSVNFGWAIVYIPGCSAIGLAMTWTDNVVQFFVQFFKEDTIDIGECQANDSADEESGPRGDLIKERHSTHPRRNDAINSLADTKFAQPSEETEFAQPSEEIKFAQPSEETPLFLSDNGSTFAAATVGGEQLRNFSIAQYYFWVNLWALLFVAAFFFVPLVAYQKEFYTNISAGWTCFFGGIWRGADSCPAPFVAASVPDSDVRFAVFCVWASSSVSYLSAYFVARLMKNSTNNTAVLSQMALEVGPFLSNVLFVIMPATSILHEKVSAADWACSTLVVLVAIVFKLTKTEWVQRLPWKWLHDAKQEENLKFSLDARITPDLLRRW